MWVEGRAESLCAHTQQEEWLEWQPVCCHPGVLRQLLFEGDEKAGGKEKKYYYWHYEMGLATGWDTIADKTRV